MAVFESTRSSFDQCMNKENMKRKANFLYAGTGTEKQIKDCLNIMKKMGKSLYFKMSFGLFLTSISVKKVF